MTKTITITYNEAYESFLMTLFKQFKIKIQPAISPAPVNSGEREPTKAEILAGLKEAVDELNAAKRGEVKLLSMNEFWEALEEADVKV